MLNLGWGLFCEFVDDMHHGVAGRLGCEAADAPSLYASHAGGDVEIASSNLQVAVESQFADDRQLSVAVLEAREEISLRLEICQRQEEAARRELIEQLVQLQDFV